MQTQTTPWNLTVTKSCGEVWLYNDAKFVARFKYVKPSVNCTAFKKFLAANFTVEEFFELAKTLAPLQVLHTKGYKSPNEIIAALHTRGA